MITICNIFFLDRFKRCVKFVIFRNTINCYYSDGMLVSFKTIDS